MYMKNKFTYFFLLLMVVTFCNYTKAQTTVWSQNFEGNAWTPTAYVLGTTAGANTTIPDGAPANVPAGGQSIYGFGNTANCLWHRSDYSTGWSTANDVCGGTYSPPAGGTNCGANGTNHSLIFDGYDAANTKVGELVYPAAAPTIDLSPYSCGGATLTFYYVNVDETELIVAFWNGSSWVTAATLFTTANAWTLETVTVPASCLINGTGVLIEAVSAFNLHPIGIDEIKLTGNSGAVPANDLCANATTITLTQAATLGNYSGSAVGTNVCAGADQGLSGCFNSNNHNVWYKFVVPVTQSYYVDVVAGTIVDPMISVLSGVCGAFTVEQGCAGDFGSTGQPNGYYSSTYSYAGYCSAPATRTVYVMVDNSTAGSSGTFTVNVATLKDDDINQPLIIDACGTTFNSTTIGATNCGDCLAYSVSGSGVYNNLDCNTSTNDPAAAGGNACGGNCGTAYGGGPGGFGSDVPYSVENDSWYEFCVIQASTVTLTFSPTTSTCKGPSNALQMSIFKGSVGNLSYLNGTVHAGVSTSTTYTFALVTNDCVFIEVDGLAGTNCDYTLQAAILPSCVLGVKLGSFTAVNDQGRIKLDWTSLQEENASKYVIERSDNGIDYKPILYKKAKGNSSTQTEFSVYDEHPIMGTGNYYRLSEFDLNGTGGVLSQIFISNVAGSPHFKVYPNPSNGKITIDMSNFSAPNVNVEICDVYGRIVWTSNVNLENGNNLQQLDLSMFEGGVYFVKASDGTNFYKQNLIISKGEK